MSAAELTEQRALDAEMAREERRRAEQQQQAAKRR